MSRHSAILVGPILVGLVALVPSLAVAATPVPGSAGSVEFFEQRIRPVLVQHCYECHSAKAKKLKGGLYLDSREGVLRGGDSGPAVIAGKPDDSPLIQALRQDGYEMPPAGKLGDQIISDFEAWVRAGAVDPRVQAPVVRREGIDLEAGRKFWSFVPPRKQPAPAVHDASWPRDNVDRFILARLEAQKQSPSPDADALTLLRRVTFDLIGLPPTPAEIDAFERDVAKSGNLPDALARVVDRLLASPHFGERWGRYWLDVARFSESTGGGRSVVFGEAWRYRDYVIRSINADKPFDRFVTEQLAGDLLPSANVEQSQDQLVATAFLLLGANNYEEQDKQALEMDIVDEQLDTLGRSLLGMTLGCARCHDHKFDPIPTRDYYALAGIMRSTRALVNKTDNVARWFERPIPLPTPEVQQWDADQAAIADLEKQIKKLKQSAGFPKGIVPVASLPGIVLDDPAGKRIGEWVESMTVRSYVGTGYVFDGDTAKGSKTITFTPEFPTAGLYEVRLAYTAHENRAAKVPVEILDLDGEHTSYVDQRLIPPIDGHFVSVGRFRFDSTNQWYVRISNEETEGSVVVDAVQFLPVSNTPVEVAKAGTPEKKTSAEKKAEAKRLAEAAPELAPLEKQLKELEERVAARPQVISVEDSKTVGDCPICVRGNVHQPGDVVPRGFLQVASTRKPISVPSTESGRRELAAWIISPENPLTARVIVNRVWAHLFGAGLVRTVDNFGRTGEAPSHPELLDSLAIEFRQQDWSIKKLVRRLVLSRTYRQSSAARAELAAIDIDNRLLGRMNRRRLDAESLRDAILSASGQLDLSFGGPTMKGSKKGDAESKYSESGSVSNDNRRSVYMPVLRNRLLEIFEAFDFADPNSVVGQRSASIVAPQALYLLNSPFVLEQARHAADEALSKTIDNGPRVDAAFLATLGRPPRDDERRLMLAVVEAVEQDNTDERREAWRHVYQALFGCLDFRYLD